MIYFLIIFSLLFMALAVWRPRWALFLICAVLPTYQVRFKISFLPVSLLEIMILILFVTYFLGNYQKFKKENFVKIRKNILGSWIWPILIWLAVATVAVFVAPGLSAAAGIWKAYFIEPILLLIVFLGLVRTKRDLSLALNALVISALVISVWAIGQKFWGGGVWSLETWGAPKIWRATGPFPHPNFLGLYLGPIILLIFGQFILNFKKKFLVYSLWLISFLLSFSAIILARSEGAILAVLVGLIFLGFIFKPSRKWALVALVVILLIISCWPLARNYIWQKANFQDLSGQLRVNIWQGAFSLIKDRPILGAGLSGYQQLIPDYQKRFYYPNTGELVSVETHPYPHNLFLTIWCELGLAGLIIFFWILIKSFWQGFRKLKSGEYSLSLIFCGSVMAALVVVIIHGLVDTPYFKNDLSVLFWLIIGLLIVGKINKDS